MIYQQKDGGAFYYKFMLGGIMYRGKCIGCTTKRQALAYEKSKRVLTTDVAEAKSVNKIIERRRAELTGSADPILLTTAFDKALAKPRAKQAAEKRIAQKRMMFGDFVAFMTAKHPEAKELAAVTKAHAEEYISYIQKNGRFLPKNTKNNRLSSSTLRRYQESIAEVFTVLAEDACIDRSPFAGIAKPAKQETQRDILTLRELALIFKNLDSFTRPLFTLATLTGLREGDICMLRWRDVDLYTGVLKLAMRKTSKVIEIPLPARVLSLIEEQRAIVGDSEYIFPEHAAMYSNNPSGVSYRVKKYLDSLGINTNKENDGRRASSIKDLHSCRHCFVHYTTNEAGASLATVKSLVGHTTLAMTEHYADHSTLEEKRKVTSAIESIIFAQPLLVGGESRDNHEDPEWLRSTMLEKMDELERILGELRKEAPKTVLGLRKVIQMCSAAITELKMYLV